MLINTYLHVCKNYSDSLKNALFQLELLCFPAHWCTEIEFSLFPLFIYDQSIV